MTWADWILFPPLLAASVLWLVCLSGLDFLRAWRLSWTMQGLAILTLPAYLLTGQPGSAGCAAGFVVLMIIERRLFTSSGPCRLLCPP
jgi:hypothetical protein